MRRKSLAILALSSVICLAGCGSSPSVPAGTSGTTEDVISIGVDGLIPDTTAGDTTESITENVPGIGDDVIVDDNTGGSGLGVSDLGSVFDNEVSSQTVNATPVTFVFKGVKYTTPSDYLVTYVDGLGPVVYINNVFQMKMVRKDDSFSNVLASLDTLDDKSISNGAKSVAEPAVKEIGGKKYAYFVVEIEGEKTMGILTESPDGSFSIGGQIAIQSDKVSYDDLINMYATIANTASITNEADSSEDDVMSQVKYITGEKRTSSTLKRNSMEITFMVPDGFYYTADSEGATSTTQFFSGSDLEVHVGIEDKAFPEDTAEYSIDCIVEYEENTAKQVETVDGKTVYICTSYYTSDSGRTYYTLTAKCDIDDEYTFVVSADRVDTGAVSFDSVKTFFEFED